MRKVTGSSPVLPTIKKRFLMAVVIHEQIKILVELQKIDSEMYRLKKEIESHPAIKQKIEADFEKKKSRMKAAEEDLKAAQLKQKSKEIDLQSKEEKIKKLQGQLYQLKSNKEYSAMDLEIKGLKADNSILEEEIIKLLDAVDQAKGIVAKEKEFLSGDEKLMKEGLSKLSQEGSQIEAALAVQAEKRKSYAPNIEPKLISQYERILKGREGLALVPVRNNSCGGCHMELPPQTINEIQIQDKLIICESCARILYWSP